MSHQFPQTSPIHTIKGFFKIYEIHIGKFHSMDCSIILRVAIGLHRICCPWSQPGFPSVSHWPPSGASWAEYGWAPSQVLRGALFLCSFFTAGGLFFWWFSRCGHLSSQLGHFLPPRWFSWDGETCWWRFSVLALRASAGILSGASAFPPFKALMAFLISILVRGLQLISNGFGAIVISAVSWGGCLLSRSLKCSVHFFTWSSLIMRSTSCERLLCACTCLNLPVSFLVVGYRLFCWLLWLFFYCCFFCLMC